MPSTLRADALVSRSLRSALPAILHPPCSLESPSAADLMSLQVSASHAAPPERPTTRSLLTWPVPFATMGPPATPFAAPRKGCLAAAVSCARGGPRMPHTVRGVFLMPDTFGDTQRAMLDATSRRPGVPWAFVLLIVWCAVEGTIFTFTLRPTMSELLSDLTGYTVNPIALVLLLWIFLTIIIAGSFACIQVLNDAIEAKEIGNIVNMIAVQIVVAMFQVLFLYRELVDAMTPWLAQQGVTLGLVSTLGLAFCAWAGVRGMTWYLFGRSGAPVLIAVLNRHGGAT